MKRHRGGALRRRYGHAKTFGKGKAPKVGE